MDDYNEQPPSVPPCPLRPAEDATDDLAQQSDEGGKPLPAEPLYSLDTNARTQAEARSSASGSASSVDVHGETPSQEALPPSTNRGVTVTLHWLSLTFFTNPAQAMTHFLDEFLGLSIEDDMEWSEHFYSLNHGARGYRAMFIGPSGVRLYAYPDSGMHCHLEVPGEVIEQIGTETALVYLRSLNEEGYEWRTKRVDVAFDHTPFTPQDCYDALKRADIRTRAHAKSWGWRENDDGDTFYIGSRKSGRLIRVYDRRGPTRLEIEFKERWALQVGAMLADAQSLEWAGTCLGYVRDYVDFVDAATGAGNISRASLLPWWADFVCGIERVRLPATEKTEPNLISSTRRFLERMSPTLYVMRHGLGISLDDAVDMAGDRISDRHRRKLQRLRELI